MKLSLRCFVSFFSVVTTILVFSEAAMGCSCIQSGTVDAAFEKTPNVVIMKLRSVEKLADGEKGYGYGGIKQSKLTVEKVFKGNLKVGQEMTFAQGGGADCVWTFTEEGVGGEYLFYLGIKPIKDNLWIAGTCTRSAGKEYAGADLLYLENLERVRGKTRLSGRLIQDIRSAVEDGESSYDRLAGRRVVISGNGKKIELKTDKTGIYEIYDLPAGKYMVTPEGLDGYKESSADKNGSVEVKIEPKSYTEQNFTFQIDNAIRGKFYDAKGKALKDVCIRLRPAKGKESQGLFAMDCTDDKGFFEIDEIPEGTYVIVINEDGLITADQPFPKFYFPSTTDREKAAEIHIEPGTFRDDLIVNAPETADTVLLTGLVGFEKGKPANNTNSKYVSIEFFSDDRVKGGENDEADSRGEIDATGRFKIKVLKGQKGRLFASTLTFEGKYLNCPKMDKFIRDSKQSMPTVKSNEFTVSAISDLSEIKLRFPFPSCQIREIN